MFSKVFLAQTSGEIKKQLPEKLAYMALHFSPYGKGLSNIPGDLPKGSILLLDDSTSPTHHDPQLVAEQLKQLITQLSPAGILLDFQRPFTEELKAMAEYIVKALPCPVGVTKSYAKDLDCPVFLSPLPANKGLEDYLTPWLKQGIYLEIAPDCIEITVTEKGSEISQIYPVQDLPLVDKRLHCHYQVEVSPHKAVFTICRHKEDLLSLVQEAESLGVLGCVGLYRELTE